MTFALDRAGYVEPNVVEVEYEPLQRASASASDPAGRCIYGLSRSACRA